MLKKQNEGEQHCYSTPSCLEFNQPKTHSQANFPKILVEILSGPSAANNCGTTAKRLHTEAQGHPGLREGALPGFPRHTHVYSEGVIHSIAAGPLLIMNQRRASKSQDATHEH